MFNVAVLDTSDMKDTKTYTTPPLMRASGYIVSLVSMVSKLLKEAQIKLLLPYE